MPCMDCGFRRALLLRLMAEGTGLLVQALENCRMRVIRVLDGFVVRVESGGAFAESVSEGIGGKIGWSVVNYG